MFPGLDLCCTDPAGPLNAAGGELDILSTVDHDLSDLIRPRREINK